MRFSFLLCILLVPFVCNGQSHGGKPTLSTKWQTLCPDMVGSVVMNTSYLNGPEFVEAYSSHEQSLRTCDHATCGNSLRRLACNLAFSKAGVLEVNAETQFPFLSYHRAAPLAQKSKVPTPTHITTNKTRIAYVVLAHDNYNQVVRLMNSIYHPSNFYVIHVDAKAGDLKNNLAAYSSDFTNIFVLEHSFDIGWGSPEMVFATLEGVFALLDLSDKWDFVINLSAKDYPLCNDEQLSSYLGTRLGSNFDDAQIPPKNDEHYWRARSTYIWCDKATCYQNHIRALPYESEPHTGSQWWVYSREFAQYLRKDSFPILMLAHYEHTWIADEGYFSTVLMNSPFHSTRIAHNLRYIVFDQIHPFYWTAADFPQIEKQTNSCFSRKFEEKSTALDLIDAMRIAGTRQLTLP